MPPLTYARHSWSLSRGSFACHTYFDMGHLRVRLLPDDLYQAVSSEAVTTCTVLAMEMDHCPSILSQFLVAPQSQRKEFFSSNDTEKVYGFFNQNVHKPKGVDKIKNQNNLKLPSIRACFFIL